MDGSTFTRDGGRLARTSQRAEAFTYRGVSFELLTDAGVGEIDPAQAARIEWARVVGGGPHVVCSVHAQSVVLDAEPEPSVVWQGEAAEASRTGIRVRVTRLGGRVYAVSARIAPPAGGLGALLDLLADVVLAVDPPG